MLGIGLVLGLAHFTFCYTSSPQKPASAQARILPIATKNALLELKSESSINVSKHLSCFSSLSLNSQSQSHD